jgi:putative phosphoesterase
MRIAVLSDLHDNLTAWQAALRYLRSEQIETIINCGDTATVETLLEMAKSFPGVMHTVFGNAANREDELRAAEEISTLRHYGDVGEVILNGKSVYFSHFPAAATKAAKSGRYDIVCYGHSHMKRWEPLDKQKAQQKQPTTWILNPGTLGGVFQYPSFATIDLQTNSCAFIDLTI